MKNFFTLFCFSLAIIFAHASQAKYPQNVAGKFADAVDYNEFIVNQQNKIGEKILVLVTSFQNPSTTKEVALENLKEVILVSQNAIDALETNEPFPSGENFKNAALNLFTFYHETFKNKYTEIIDILFKETPTPQDETRLGELFTEMQGEESVADEKYTKAQNEFAEKNNFKLKDNSFQEQFQEK